MTRAEEILSRHGANLPWERGRGRDTWAAAVAAVEEALTEKNESCVRRIAACLRDSFAPPLDEGTSIHIARNIAALTSTPEPVPATNQAGDVAKAYTAGFEQGWEWPRETSPTEAAERYARGYVATLATQPATSQEGEGTLANPSTFGKPTFGLAATPTPPTLSEDLREAIEGVIEHVEVRIQDGKEIGSTVWRLALEDVARDLRAALVKQRAAPKPAPVTIPPARSYADEDVARMIDPWAWDEAERYRVRADHWFAKGRTEPGDCLTDGYRARADAMQAPLLAKAAAIRLLSQGGKA